MATKEEMQVLQDKQEEVIKALNSKEIKHLGKGMDESEQKDICVVISSAILREELERRERIAVEILKEVTSTIANSYDKSMTLEQMESLISEIRKIVRVSN